MNLNISEKAFKEQKKIKKNPICCFITTVDLPNCKSIYNYVQYVCVLFHILCNAHTTQEFLKNRFHTVWKKGKSNIDGRGIYSAVGPVMSMVCLHHHDHTLTHHFSSGEAKAPINNVTEA